MFAMANYICTTCGVQYGDSEAPPDVCPICEDERQYVNWHGQQWTTLGELRHDYANAIRGGRAGAHGHRHGAARSPSGSARCWWNRPPATCCGTASA